MSFPSCRRRKSGSIMISMTQSEFNKLLSYSDIKSRFIKELKFVASTSNLSDDWADYELLSITDRTENAGILLLQPENALYAGQYEISRRIIDASTGRDRAIICDFCYTWQPGSNAASITFASMRTKHNVR